ncbi:DNA polymerase III subunit gamma and tau [Corynebacterium sp. p3-SID1194]|uniref:DNA polymerase III subunit gamma and tau n=1 Tax=Corynebacterium sp. p3-SID1194 TaxID=2916105 RepID=UPI0021A2C1D7|nr:DNA polymerase III subunit gamma and tau [Corynebacterium sp. p3-SID1194]MCT1450969.1 DNA polymerase III subunit gamma and tau [Corynebacterium sp. p3-SID1194]
MALYRKYRPASFAEMIGQEQVTRPLSTALDNGRVNHAYLFSGPRGTGKTSSARILARSLNCVQGPTSTPCGVCPSCVALAPGGPGNLDVTEMDAASNGGVDEMRELRERAYFAPAESRYRVFIIDEAHMITGAGANALLKIVEEPPEHLVFIFATTEPEKIIGTIRSRTHHYPFRLLTPQAMRQLVERTVAAEGVTVDENVYPLVIRAGGGSPRDTLSILDQLLAGAGPEGLTYELALPLLGVTDLSLIDATVDALSSRDASALFQAVDDVIEAGHEPRRFAIDLLDRLRDLMIIHAVPDAFGQGLVDAPADRAEILTAEADKFPGNQLAALATEVNERITSLRGATSPRLLLEIMMAHLLGVLTGTQAPAAVAGLTEIQDAASEAAGMGDKPRGAAAALAAAAAVQATANVTSQSTPAPREAPKPAREQREPQREQPAAPAQQPTQQPAQRPAQQPVPQPAPAEPEQATTSQDESPRDTQREVPQQPEPETHIPEPSAKTETEVPASSPGDTGGALDATELMERIRKEWINLRQSVGERNKVAEIMLTEATPLGMDGNTLVVGHNTGALANSINSKHNNDDIVAVLTDKLGTEVAVRCVVGTDPKAAGFEAPARAPQAWSPPSAPKQPEAQGPEHTSPSDDEADSADEDPHAADGNEPDEPTPTSDGSVSSENEAVTPEPEAAPVPYDPWASTPAKTVNPEDSGAEAQQAPAAPSPEPSPQPAPAQPEQPAPEASGPAAAAAAAAAAAGAAGVVKGAAPRATPDPTDGPNTGFGESTSFSSGVPLPPEPEDEPPMEEEPAPYTREDEERDMVDQSQEAGTFDRRSPTEVAMELLADELGARPL